jgi:hypothetical protein
MDVFKFRNRIIDDYSGYVSSFISIAQPRLREFVDRCFTSGSLWPDPLIQLNPTFKPGGTVDELVRLGVLEHGCSQVFRREKTAAVGSGEDLLFHQHQEDAIRKAKEGRNYVLTTGTGSGKSLAYIVPIVDHVLRAGSGRGIQAIIIYPMNALANSQFGELEKFLKLGFADGRGPVTFERYTGQEDEETRTRIIATPPDILLTNYVMLELILTRPREKKLIASAKGLKFLVLDELHTYRGRQGADVALLLRRVRELLDADAMQCVGTSATLAGRGSWEEQREGVARLATRLFGDEVEGSDIIGETLERATNPIDEANAADLAALSAVLAPDARRLPETFDQLAADPIARWVEGTFGIVPKAGRLIRSPSIPLTGKNGAAERLAKLTGTTPERCKDIVAETLLAGATRIRHPRTGFPVFAFRLHQFISRGDTLYATVESPEQRYLTIHGQIYSPEDRNKVLLPLCFCRECGQEYYSVCLAKDPQTGVQRFLSREANERTVVVGQKQGLLYINPQKPWPRDTEMETQLGWLPPDWVEERGGKRQVIPSRRERMPRHYVVKPDGSIGSDGLDAAFIPVPFMFCLGCGVSHTARQRSDFSKLGTLGSEGRSTATTILTTSAVAGLQREETIKPEARKLLSFTDNRQDASLQSGHLNDFIEVGLLRGAIYKAAVDAGAEGLRDDTISQKVTTALGLRFEDYAKDPTIRYGRDKVENALRDVVGYRVYRDLRRGWRVNSPNLEQCGLIEITPNSTPSPATTLCGRRCIRCSGKRAPRLARSSAGRSLISSGAISALRWTTSTEIRRIDLSATALTNFATRGLLIRWKNSTNGNWLSPARKALLPMKWKPPLFPPLAVSACFCARRTLSPANRSPTWPPRKTSSRRCSRDCGRRISSANAWRGALARQCLAIASTLVRSSGARGMALRLTTTASACPRLQPPAALPTNSSSSCSAHASSDCVAFPHASTPRRYLASFGCNAKTIFALPNCPSSSVRRRWNWASTSRI